MKKLLLASVIASISAASVAAEHVHSQDCEHYGSLNYVGKAATEHTIAANAELAGRLPWQDDSAFERTNRGLVAKFGDHSAGEVKNRFGFKENMSVEEVPDTVNPSIWRQGMLNYIPDGLYKVTDGLWQIRGADISNMTIYQTDNGYLIHDPLLTREAAADAWDFAKQHLPEINGEHKVTGVIYSHTHNDHFGGVRGLFEDGELPEGVGIYAPAGFMELFSEEHLLGGTAMGRRAQYQYGVTLQNSETGIVDSAIGLGASFGEITLLPPTHEIQEREETVIIDGLEVLFVNMPGAEAPAEMINYVPKYNALNTAELTYDGMHNIYTFRGAKIRDSLAWTKYLSEMKLRWGDALHNLHGSHSAPVWNDEGNEISDYLTMQRDNYGFIHNQSMRLANQGVKIHDVGREIERIVPQAQFDTWHTNGYHGSYSHNARAVVNLYLGYHDMNPVNTNPLQASEKSCVYVNAAGAETLFGAAKEHFEQGEYQEAGQLLNDVVTCNPQNVQARHLLADTWEQQGYQSETMAWRNSYLQGTYELRTNEIPESMKTVSQDIMTQTATSGFLDFVAITVDAAKAEAADLEFTMNVVHPDIEEYHYIEFSNGNLAPLQVNSEIEGTDATLYVDRSDFTNIITGDTTLEKLLESGKAEIKGDKSIPTQLADVTVELSSEFEIVPMMNNQMAIH